MFRKKDYQAASLLFLFPKISGIWYNTLPRQKRLSQHMQVKKRNVIHL